MIAGVERVMGVEPTYQPWEGRILPMNYTRTAQIFYHTILKKQEIFQT
jgi:hypothetical protein